MPNFTKGRTLKGTLSSSKKHRLIALVQHQITLSNYKHAFTYRPTGASLREHKSEITKTVYFKRTGQNQNGKVGK